MLLKISCGLPKVIRCVASECTDIKEMATTVVRDYLSGPWKQANSSNLTVQKLKGGLSNWLYRVTLSPLQSENEPFDSSTVLLRIHGPNYGKFAVDQIVTDSLVFMMMSERRLGPKLHGVFPGGRIEEYIHARSLKVNELGHPHISSAIASKMAHIHSLNVPISKNPELLFELMNKWMMELQNNWEVYKVNKLTEDLELMDKFKNLNVRAEIQWLREHLKQLNSKVVFCHNDLQEGNILIRHDSIESDKPSLVVIDYEYCSYNYRAFELANHFLEYTMSYKNNEYPYFTTDMFAYPTLEQQVNFVRRYLDVYNDLSGSKTLKDGTNESYNFTGRDQKLGDLNVTSQEYSLLVEISHFRLLSHLLWGIWSAAHSKTGIEFGYWEYSILRLNAYFQTKEEVLSNEPLQIRKEY